MKNIIISCEHGGNKIPVEYKKLFIDAREQLNSHFGFDPGALELAKEISENINADLYYSEISRLLVDLNRSRKNPKLFSKFLISLNKEEKGLILKNYYEPYRLKIEETIKRIIQKNEKVIHISVHSFTPVLHNIVRNSDIGLLYDPKRETEKDFAILIRKELFKLDESLKIRLNYPYLGTSDGLTTYLRKKFHGSAYVGIEIEANQKFILNDPERWEKLKKNISNALRSILKME